MTTVINNPNPSDNSSGPITLIIFLIVVVVLGYLGIVYGIPALRNIHLGTPQIDVNLKQGK